MTNEKYNPTDLTEVATKLYHALTGTKPDDALKERIQAGVEAAVKLYKMNPKMLYALSEAMGPTIDKMFEPYSSDTNYSPSRRFVKGIEDAYRKEKSI